VADSLEGSRYGAATDGSSADSGKPTCGDADGAPSPMANGEAALPISPGRLQMARLAGASSTPASAESGVRGGTVSAGAQRGGSSCAPATAESDVRGGTALAQRSGCGGSPHGAEGPAAVAGSRPNGEAKARASAGAAGDPMPVSAGRTSGGGLPSALPLRAAAPPVAGQRQHPRGEDRSAGGAFFQPPPLPPAAAMAHQTTRHGSLDVPSVHASHGRPHSSARALDSSSSGRGGSGRIGGDGRSGVDGASASPAALRFLASRLSADIVRGGVQRSSFGFGDGFGEGGNDGVMPEPLPRAARGSWHVGLTASLAELLQGSPEERAASWHSQVRCRD